MVRAPEPEQREDWPSRELTADELGQRLDEVQGLFFQLNEIAEAGRIGWWKDPVKRRMERLAELIEERSRAEQPAYPPGGAAAEEMAQRPLAERNLGDELTEVTLDLSRVILALNRLIGPGVPLAEQATDWNRLVDRTEMYRTFNALPPEARRYWIDDMLDVLGELVR